MTKLNPRKPRRFPVELEEEIASLATTFGIELVERAVAQHKAQIWPKRMAELERARAAEARCREQLEQERLAAERLSQSRCEMTLRAVREYFPGFPQDDMRLAFAAVERLGEYAWRKWYRGLKRADTWAIEALEKLPRIQRDEATDEFHKHEHSLRLFWQLCHDAIDRREIP